MAAGDETFLRRLICQGIECNNEFLVCTGCYRGQRYCCETCRKRTQLHQHRIANRRYRATPKARSGHCMRQQRYRRIGSKNIVPDETSILICFGALSEYGKVEPTIIETPQHFRAAGLPEFLRKESEQQPCCRICGRTGSLAESFRPFSHSVFS